MPGQTEGPNVSHFPSLPSPFRCRGLVAPHNTSLTMRVHDPQSLLMDKVLLQPGRMTLAGWRVIHAGAGCELDLACMPAVERGARAVDAILREGRTGLRHQHRLRPPGQRPHRAGRSRRAPTQHRAVACRRRGRADAGAARAADDGIEARQPRARSLGRADGNGARSWQRCCRATCCRSCRRKGPSARRAISRRSRTWQRR